MTPPDDLFLRSGSRRLHVAAWGDPGAPPVILIHGLCDHCRNWDWIAQDLARDYRVIAPDLRGHGDSDWVGADGYTLAIDHLVAHALTQDAGLGWRWKFDPAARLRPPEDQHGHDVDAVLAAIACPVLLAYGSESWVPLPSAQRLALLRNHRIVHFPGGTHWLHHQELTRFTQVVTEFLQSAFRNQHHA